MHGQQSIKFKQLQWSRGTVLPLSTQIRGFEPI